MNEVRRLSTVRVKRENLELVLKHSDVIYNLFSFRITNLTEADKSDSTFVYVVLECAEEFYNKSRIGVQELQNYVNKLCSRDSNVKEEGDETSHGEEDSSYDSDFEGEEPKSHRDVSRTVSDTLAAEFSEYVSRPPSESYCSQYAAKVEFGLKLGYTEQNVQSALGKLGPNPSQNELLAELIQLGARSPRSPDSEGILSDDGAIEPAASGLRPIVVDGSNVAMAHGNKEVFSCKGIKICVDWFRNRGHNDITVFVPKWRKEASRPDNLIADQEILTELERERIVVFTPSRLVGGKRTICYDDRYILRLAVEVDGIVVSNDNYRDLAQESSEFKKVVEERTLMYSFVNDRFMPPDDPLGRSGPTLDNFLRIQSKRSDPVPHCPYGKKCTYGNKCKYHHPERGSQPHKSVTERLFEHAQKHWQARGSKEFVGTQIKGKSLSVPLGGDDVSKHLQQQQHSQLGFSKKTPLTRTKSGNPTCLTHFNIGSGSDRVGKSKSVDNIFSEKTGAHGTRPASNSSWKTVSGPSADRQYPHRPVQGSIHKNLGQRLSDPMPSSPDVPGNIHRKLERQLTLNPYEWPMALQGRSSSGRERPSVEAAYWDHQNVTRIASAPESCLPAGAQSQMHRLSSSSDPHINLCVADAPARPDAFESPSRWVPTNASLIYPTAVPLRLAPTVPQPQPQLQNEVYSKGEARRKLHYHLSAIFPEEHVRAALQLYPEETKPQEICAAILAMFPSDHRIGLK